MNKFHSYLKDKSRADFAKAIGTSPAYLSQMVTGHRRPSYAMMLKIELASEGCVDLRSWSPEVDASLGGS